MERDIQIEEWKKGLISQLGNKELISVFFDKASDDIVDENRTQFISEHIRKMIDDGYKSVYSGEEVLEAVRERKARIFDTAVDTVCERMMIGLMGKLQKKNDEKPLLFDDFLFLILAKNKPNIKREAFTYLLNGEGKRGCFIDADFEEYMSKKTLSLPIDSGIDVLAEVFFETFSSEEEIRESLLLPSAEDIFRLDI